MVVEDSIYFFRR